MLRRFLLVVLAGGVAFGAYWWLTMPVTGVSAAEPAHTPNLANGQIIFNAGGCASCHAVPGQPDRTRLGGGLALPSPFGTFYGQNIFQDPKHGLGPWSEADFVNAVRKGISPDGSHYFPAFPYTSYAHATAPDVRDLFAFMKTLPP